MDELLRELENFKYNLNMSELEDYKLDERVNEIISIKEEIEENREKIKDLVEKIKDENNYKKNGQELYDQQRRFNLLNAIKEAEILENENNSLIAKLNIEITYGETQEIKDLKRKELGTALDKRESLRSQVEEYKEILNNFERINSNNDDIDREKFEKDKKIVNTGQKLIKALESREKFLSYDYEKELNNIINEVKNNAITFEEAKTKFNGFKNKIDENFLDIDLEKRQEELEQNREAQKDMENKIEEIKKKLDNKENYYNSKFIDERTSEMKEKWNNKLNDVLINIDRLNLENDKIINDEREYKNIIEICSNENLELGKLLRELENDEQDKVLEISNKLTSNREAIKEANDCLNELKAISENNMVTIINLDNKKERIKNISETLNKKQTENSINKHQIFLDENKLSKMVEGLNALKNREQFLKTSLHENLDNIQNIKNNKKAEEEKQEKNVEKENKTNVKEIVSVKRPLKERIKNKIKKVSKVIAASLTAALLLSNPALAPQSENDSTTLEPTLEQQIDNSDISDELERNVEDEDELNSINIDDIITIKDGAGIYKNHYDSSYKNNAYNPRFERSMEREVMGISVMTQEGAIKFVQNENELNKLLTEGAIITSYLTGKDNVPEGFWNANDVTKVIKLDKTMEGGMTR